MISVENFAREELRHGKKVHFHDGVWWVKVAPFYYKPVQEYHPFPPKSVRPHPLRALLGYSHQVSDTTQATRLVRMNVCQGEDLRRFSLERINGKRRNLVRMGLKSCRIDALTRSDALLEQMRLINIGQAKKLESAGERGSFLPSAYYDKHATRWRAETCKLFSHPGHQFVGAFVGDELAAYINLVMIEDTWLFGAVKSGREHLACRPVDALYFTVLSMASQSGTCSRVVNGGGAERESLVHFKEEFLLKSVPIPYYSWTLLPLSMLRAVKGRITRQPKPPVAADEKVKD